MKVAQSYSTLCNFMDCTWNSPGQNTGEGSLALLQGISPTQGLNPGLLHCRQILYQLSYHGSPILTGACESGCRAEPLRGGGGPLGHHSPKAEKPARGWECRPACSRFEQPLGVGRAPQLPPPPHTVPCLPDSQTPQHSSGRE